MDLWRICRAKYQETAFTGRGAEQTGGRWNFPGHAMVYASENLSLAVLELLVHLSPGTLPGDLIAIRAALPEAASMEQLSPGELPTNWRTYPAHELLQVIGTAWLERGASLVLRVPSAMNPHEHNLLVNPAHPEMKKLVVEPGEPFTLDPRLFGK